MKKLRKILKLKAALILKTLIRHTFMTYLPQFHDQFAIRGDRAAHLGLASWVGLLREESTE